MYWIHIEYFLCVKSISHLDRGTRKVIDVQTKIIDWKLCSQMEGGNVRSTRDYMSRAKVSFAPLRR